MSRTILEELQEKYDVMTKKQKIMAQYIVTNYRTAAFMNTKDLARAAGVSESTVIRLASVMGCDRFVDFQKLLQDLVRIRISSLEKFNANKEDFESTAHYIFSLEKSIMDETLNSIDFGAFQQVVDMIQQCERLFIVGAGADDVVAKYAAKFFRIMRENVMEIKDGDDIDIFHKMKIDEESGTVVLAYHFPRYYRFTLDIVRILKNKKAKIVGVTDNILAPIISLSDLFFIVPSRYVTIVDPSSAIFALTHALLTELVKRDPQKAQERLEAYYNYSNAMNRCIIENMPITLHI